MNDETVRLILDLAGSSKDVGELIGNLGRLKEKADDVGGTYQVLTGEMGTYGMAARTATTATQQYNPAMDAMVAKAVEATRTQKLFRESLETTAVAQDKLAGVSRQNSQRILELGRATQDFVQGGFAGILNNIERIVGGGGLLAGVLTAVGTAAFLAKPFIEEWWKSLTDASTKIPPAKDAIDRMTESIAKNRKEIESLREQQSLTWTELDKYKKLIEDTSRLEEEQANAREARSVKNGSSKEDRANASSVHEAIAERYGNSQELINETMASESGQQIGLKRVEEMIAQALKGNGLEIDNLRNVNPKFSEEYEPFSPKAKAETEARKESLKKEKEFTDRRMKEIEEDDRLKKELNQKGQEADREIQKLKDQEISDRKKEKADREKRIDGSLRMHGSSPARVTPQGGPIITAGPGMPMPHIAAGEPHGGAGHPPEVAAPMVDDEAAFWGQFFAQPHPQGARKPLSKPAQHRADLRQGAKMRRTLKDFAQMGPRPKRRGDLEGPPVNLGKRKQTAIPKDDPTKKAIAQKRVNDAKAAQDKAAQDRAQRAQQKFNDANEGIDDQLLPTMRGGARQPVGPSASLSPVLGQLVANQAALAQQQKADIQRLQRDARQVGATIASNRSASSIGMQA